VTMWRVTLAPVVLNSAADVVFTVAGAAKARVLQQVLEGPYQPDRLPAQLVRPSRGGLTWLVDRAAAAQLSAAPQGERVPNRRLEPTSPRARAYSQASWLPGAERTE
jgi:hypothetical protein